MARKSKAFEQLRQQTRESSLERRGFEALRKNLEGTGAELVANPKGEIRMSDVLERFVRPYLSTAQNHGDREILFNIAIMAWNLASLPDEKRDDKRQELWDMLPVSPRSQRDLVEILDELVERKLDKFADIKRLIAHFEYQRNGADFHITVASTFIPKADGL